jgi:hypothetical protein
MRRCSLGRHAADDQIGAERHRGRHPESDDDRAGDDPGNARICLDQCEDPQARRREQEASRNDVCRPNDADEERRE